MAILKLNFPQNKSKQTGKISISRQLTSEEGADRKKKLSFIPKEVIKERLNPGKTMYHFFAIRNVTNLYILMCNHGPSRYHGT